MPNGTIPAEGTVTPEQQNQVVPSNAGAQVVTPNADLETIGGVMRRVSKISGHQKQKSAPVLIKEKEAPAYIYVIKNKAPENALVDHPRGYLEFMSNKFFLTNMQETHTEKIQILETFGEPLLYFFNERTKVYAISGFFLNSHEFSEGWTNQTIYNWALAFRTFYDQELRGTKLAKNGNIAILSVDSMLMYGYPISFTVQTSGNTPNITAFSMSMVVVKHVVVPAANAVADSDTASPTNIAKWRYKLNDLWKLKKETLNETQTKTLAKHEEQVKILSDQITKLEHILHSRGEVTEAGQTLSESHFAKYGITDWLTYEAKEKELANKKDQLEWYINKIAELHRSWVMDYDNRSGLA